MQQNRPTTLFLTTAVTALCALSVQNYLSLDSWVLWVGIATALTSATLIFIQSVPRMVEPFLRTAGYVLLAVGVYAFFSPTFGGDRPTYFGLANIVLLIEAAIVLLLHGTAGRAVKSFGFTTPTFLVDMAHAGRTKTSSAN